jgi:hypothetical protein
MFRRIGGFGWRGALAAAAVLAGGLLACATARADVAGFNGGDNGTINNTVGGDPPFFDGDVLAITTDAGDEHNSVFYNTPQSVTAFCVQFTYQVSGNMDADGITFCIQNDPAGVNAVGTDPGGSALGYHGIMSSAAFALNIFAGWTRGENLFLDSDFDTANPVYNGTAPLDLHSGDPIEITLVYDGARLMVLMIDTVTGDMHCNSYDVDIPGTVGGDSAYIGFTGGTGGFTSVQQVTGFRYIEL